MVRTKQHERDAVGDEKARPKPRPSLRISADPKYATVLRDSSAPRGKKKRRFKPGTRRTIEFRRLQRDVDFLTTRSRIRTFIVQQLSGMGSTVTQITDDVVDQLRAFLETVLHSIIVRANELLWVFHPDKPATRLKWAHVISAFRLWASERVHIFDHPVKPPALNLR